MLVPAETQGAPLGYQHSFFFFNQVFCAALDHGCLRFLWKKLSAPQSIKSKTLNKHSFKSKAQKEMNLTFLYCAKNFQVSSKDVVPLVTDSSGVQESPALNILLADARNDFLMFFCRF